MTPRPDADESGGARIRRLLARFIGAGYAAYLAAAIVESGRQFAPVQWWWAPAALTLAVAPGLVLLAASFGTGTAVQRWCRIAVIWAVVGYAVAAVSWPLAWTGDGVDDSSSSTWLVRFSGLVGLAAALVFRPVRAILVQAAATAVSSVINQMGLISAQSLWPRIAAETIWAWGFSGVFVAAAVMAVHTSRVLDATEELVARTAAASAANTARARERTKFDALVHDRVLAVLLDAARTVTPHRLPAQARAALSALDELTSTTGGETASADSVVERLRTEVGGLDPVVIVSVDEIADLRCRYPVEAVTAIIDAAAEAVRNSVLHADSASIRVELTLAADDMRVVITDHGRGFDLSTVEPGRLGVVGSIAGRMEQITGGSADIVTEVGSGTTVELRWNHVEPSSPPSTSQHGDARKAAGKTRTDFRDWGIADIVGLRSRWTVMVTAVFVLCAAVAALTSITAGMAALPALASLALLTVGVGAVALPDGDVLGRRWTAVCVWTGPLQITAAAAGLTEPIPDPIRNAAAISGGLVVCAFLCVRGRTGWAWLSQGTTCALYAVWVIRTGSELASMGQVIVSGIGVMILATVFAALLRPAAREIYALRAAESLHAAETAALEATMQERLTQLARLNTLARPVFEHLSERPELSGADKNTMLLLEARLRDGIRARGLDTPALTDAVWKARARGVEITLLDDGALSGVRAETVARLISSITDHVDTADAGTAMTIRIAPPHREYLATLTTTTASGRNSRLEFDNTAATVTGRDDQP